MERSKLLYHLLLSSGYRRTIPAILESNIRNRLLENMARTLYLLDECTRVNDP
jgi:hypothetical protein